MDVGFSSAGAVVVDHVRDALAALGDVRLTKLTHLPTCNLLTNLNVEAALGDVRGDEQRLVAVLELLEHPVALLVGVITR
eukprot:scaffold130480_cov54-Phaeocystis_antarctica.AAC.1